jgi:hypothetical protein
MHKTDLISLQSELNEYRLLSVSSDHFLKQLKHLSSCTNGKRKLR